MKKSLLALLFIFITFNLTSGQVDSSLHKQTNDLELKAKNHLIAQKIPFTETAFLENVATGKTEIVALFLDTNININITNQEKNTALMLASKNNHKNIVKLLINKGCDISLRNNQGYLALDLATDDIARFIVEFLTKDNQQVLDEAIVSIAYRGNKELMQILLNKGANVSAKDARGNTALKMAIYKCNMPLVEFILDKIGGIYKLEKNELNDVIEIASRYGCLDTIKMISKFVEIPFDIAIDQAIANHHLSIVNYVTDLQNQDRLFKAVMSRNIQVAKNYLDKVTDVNITDRRRISLLTYAVKSNDIDLVKLILDKGADVNLRGYNSYNQVELPLISAIKNQNLSLVKLLLDRGADPNLQVYKYEYGNLSALETAIVKENIAIIELLLSKYELNQYNTRIGFVGYAFPLVLAVKQNNQEIIKIIKKALIEKGLYNAESLLLPCIEAKTAEFVKELLDEIGNEKIRSKHFPYLGIEALIKAISVGNIEIVEILLNKAVDINGMEKKRPINIAIAHNQFNIVKLLIKRNVDLKIVDNNNLLSKAIETSNIELVKLLIDAGLDVNETFNCNETALMVAAKKGAVEIVKFLLAAGAKADAKDCSDETALVLAVKYGRTEILSVLEITSKEERSNLLLVAVQARQSELIDTLLDADLNFSDSIGATALIYAIKTQNVEIINKLIKKGADVNFQQKLQSNNNQSDIDPEELKSLSPLMHAVETGNLDIVKLLVNNGANVNAISYFSPVQAERFTKNKQTALSLAVYYLYGLEKNREEIVKFLIDQGADVNFTSGGERSLYNTSTILLSAINNNAKEVVAKLLEKGAEPLDSYLNIAVEKAGQEIFTLLLNNGAKPNKETLIIACRLGYLNIVKLLLDKGLSANSSDDYSFAIHSAANAGHLNVVDLLIERGANINEVNYIGATALMLALNNKHLEVARLLLNKAADINIKDKDGKDTLSYAAQSTESVKLIIDKVSIKDRDKALIIAVTTGNFDLVKLLYYDSNLVKEQMLIAALTRCKNDIINFLLDKGISVNTKMDDGTSLLMLAVSRNCFSNNDEPKEIPLLLIEKGADINLKTSYGWTALMFAVSNSYKLEDVIKTLLAKGADINNVSSEGITPLMIAVEKSYGQELTKLLINNGANIHLTDKRNRTPLFFAIDTHFINEEAAKLLLEKGANPNWQDNKGRTPLIALSEKYYRDYETKQIVDIVVALLAKGADPTLKNSDGQTALDIAKLQNHKEIIELLE